MESEQVAEDADEGLYLYAGDIAAGDPSGGKAGFASDTERG